MKLTLFASALSALAMTFSFAACEELQLAYDCAAVCDRYTECFDEDYDRSECATNCEDEADLSEEYATQVVDCEACISDNACTEGAENDFECANECSGIVP